jgi:hypothetical protein
MGKKCVFFSFWRHGEKQLKKLTKSLNLEPWIIVVFILSVINIKLVVVFSKRFFFVLYRTLNQNSSSRKKMLKMI